MGNTYGTLFKITTFGESHGLATGVVIDGCPAGLEIDEAFIQAELNRRKPGQSKITTQRKEDDTFKILSGVFEGKTTGAPIAIVTCRFYLPRKIWHPRLSRGRQKFCPRNSRTSSSWSDC